MRKTMHALFLAAGLCWGAAATAAVAVELAGVKVEDAVTVSGTKLQLNGAGIRYKGPFKVYVGDLYTTRRVSSLDDLIAAPGPKRLSMTFLRDINSAEFGKLLTRGMEDNVSKQELSKIIPGMIKMGDIFAANKSFAPGDVCSLEWDPAKGLSVYAKGKLQAEPFKDPAFYRALMSIWFGNTPADWKLKDELLGVKPQPQ
ncbi:chalcone isomerase family protein [Acidovorax sp. JHL-3]|jgi:hypothetical protein|uniref:chalcone isomerase family protein n=1 Tax=Acidovorax sp. JHL-3 TaxID=1276755 RepID=UPI0004ACCA57|nr:chalcone isomerase family protein [Acidovorax sp. JHL-3]